MSTLTVSKNWEVDGAFTAPDSNPTLGIWDNTVNAQVVPAGTVMSGSGGQYQYLYASAVAGHTYTSTMLVTWLGTVYSSQVVSYVPPSTTIPETTDDGSSGYMAAQWAAQRGLWTSVKNSCLSAIVTALALGEGPSYSISGSTGSESLSFNEFLSNMRETAAKATEIESELTQHLQDATPFQVIQRKRIGGRWGFVDYLILATMIAMAATFVLGACISEGWIK